MKKYNSSSPLLITLSIFLFFPFLFLNAQRKLPYDSSYFTVYPNSVTARFYFSQKYISLNFPASGNVKDFQYTPNAKLNMGIGATYHNFSLNLAYGFGFLNNDLDEKGKTKSLDFQLHLYREKWVIDALAMFYKNLYITPQGFAAVNNNSYYQRPDVKQDFIGLAAYRVMNSEKFSYRAAMIQNEWQKKSAGSLLFGGQAYYGILKADTSALVPATEENNFKQAGIDKINFFSIGPGIGYAYTLVIEKHLYIMASLIGNIDINFTTEEKEKGSSKENKTSVNPAGIYKAAIGYNSRAWDVSANLAGNAMWFTGAS
ncbi:MAG: DUF4421 domain-containing protein, partial [Parafilimonas sp.]